MVYLLNYDKHPPTEEPSRITNHTATLIDKIFFNSVEYETTCGNLICDRSDHLPSFLVISKLPVLNQKEEKYKRACSKFNEEDLLNEFSSVDWPNLFCELTDVSQMFENFYLKVCDSIHKFLPLRLLSKKEAKF